jgi:hypothetical protein
MQSHPKLRYITDIYLFGADIYLFGAYIYLFTMDIYLKSKFIYLFHKLVTTQLAIIIEYLEVVQYHPSICNYDNLLKARIKKEAFICPIVLADFQLKWLLQQTR